MQSETFLVALTGLTFSRSGDVRIGRFSVSVKLIISTPTADFDTDEIAALIRAYSEMPENSVMQMAREIRDEVLGVTGVISCIVCVTDLRAYDDADGITACTLPDPRHAVLYGLM